LSRDEFKLISIFSRRSEKIKSEYKTKIESMENILKYRDKIDVLLLCGGSEKDMPIQAPQLAKNFSIVNTFDTHAKIYSEYKKIDAISEKNKEVAIISCGWDPGLFSLMRLLFKSVMNTEVHTFWGKGTSMGHSEVLKKLEGVKRAVQLTVPNEKAIKLLKENKECDLPLHFRECYIVPEPSANLKELEKTIKNIPHYFKGQPTTVHFITEEEFKEYDKFLHGGRVFSHSEKNESKNNIELLFKTSSNPQFTAKVMLAYTFAVNKLKKEENFGCFTPLEIPFSYLLPKSTKQIIQDFC
jgi:diaminopimelate dehydrogenase